MPKREEDIVILVVRAKDEDAIKDIPEEYLGYPIQAAVVPSDAFERMLEAEKKAGLKK